MKVLHTEIRRLTSELEEGELYEVDAYSPCDERLLVEPKHLGIEGFPAEKNRQMALYHWINEPQERPTSRNSTGARRWGWSGHW